HRWPGNVRELKNVIHRAFVLSDDEVVVDIVEPVEGGADPVAPTEPQAPACLYAVEAFAVKIPVGMSLDDAERALITATLDSVSGSKAKAAQVLGISLKTLYNRLHAYGAAGLPRKSRQELDNVGLAA
ncbi:MAG: helix-turn-helix domain-containing protein, partial [Casimicrobiaceae bacterium]